MKKIIYPILILLLVTIQCKKKSVPPDISGDWWMIVNTTEVPIDSTTTWQYAFPQYAIKLTKISNMLYKYTISNLTTLVDYTGKATYNQQTKEFFFDTFYEKVIDPDVKGHFLGRFDKNKNTIEGILSVPVFLSLGIGHSRYQGVHTTFLFLSNH